MKGRYLAENLYKSRIANPIPPVSSGGNPLDEFQILCEKAPKYDKGWIFVDFDNPDKAKRDLIFFHKKEGNTLTYYRKNRDLLNNGSKSARHEEGASIQLNDVSEWINSLSYNSEDFGFIEQGSDSEIDITVYGGKVEIFGKRKVVADKKMKLTDDTTTNVFFDYKEEDFKLYSDTDLANKVGILIAKITTKDKKIKSFSDERAFQVGASFSKKFFDIINGELSLKDGVLSEDELTTELKAKIRKIHDHDNKDALDKFKIKDGKLFRGDKDFEAQGESNAAASVGGGISIYKDKYGQTLRFKTINASGGISIVEDGDTLNIVGGMVTETHRDIITGDRTKKDFVLEKEVYNDGLIWIITEAGTSLVYGSDFIVLSDRKTVRFVEAPVEHKHFITYITKSDLGVQTSGEANTASNNNTQGFGVFNRKDGVNLVFNRLVAGDNTTLSQNTDGSIVINSQGGGGAGGSATKSIVGIPDGMIDGINKVFALPSTPLSEDGLLVFSNGLLQKKNSDYTLTGDKITFITAPDRGDELIYEMYTKIAENMVRENIPALKDSKASERETDSYYTLSHTPKAIGTRLRVNGVFMIDGRDFKIEDKKLYIKNVQSGDEIQLLYFYS